MSPLVIAFENLQKIVKFEKYKKSMKNRFRCHRPRVENGLKRFKESIGDHTIKFFVQNFKKVYCQKLKKLTKIIL